MDDRIEELERRIEEADKAYWQDNSPVISDFDYDKLVNELRRIDPTNPLRMGGIRE